MPKHPFQTRFAGTVESADLDELRRDMILEIEAALAAIAWVLALTAIGFGGNLRRLYTALILFAGSLGSFGLRRIRVRAALYLPVAASVAAVAAEKLLFPQGLAQYYFPLAVVVSGLVVSHLGVFVVATIAAVAHLAVARLQGPAPLNSQQVLTPTLLIYLTAFAAWLGSRQMHMALGWMQSSYTQARSLLEELRDRRMSLARTNKALEEAYSRIERMNYALIEARSAAEEARRLKAEFAANVSHELRTPLNIILGFSETMANVPETYRGVTWSPALRADVQQIHESSRHLASLIDDILDLSAMGVHRLGLTVEQTDIAGVVNEAVAVVANLFHAKGLYLVADTARDVPRVRIDAIRIRQVLINLLTNASRFTETGGTTVTSRLVGREVQVTVADTGVGIAPHDIPKVFEDFGQVDGSAARRHEGTGLGVPLSKRLVELHGGRMWLESTPGQGTAFHFTLPAFSQAAPGSPPGLVRTPGPELPYRRALLALAPDPVVLRAIRRHMSAYDVIEIRNPEEIPASVEQNRPVALLVAQQGPDRAGPTEASMAGLPADLPAITVSLPNILGRARALGIANVLIKPVTREHLLQAVTGLGRVIHDVLIVDDEPQLVDLYGRMLQSAGAGYHPVKSHSGAEALARMRQQAVDLVLLDLLMREMSGLEVLEAMKADPALAGTPVIVVSAQYPEPVRSEGGLLIQLVRAQDASLAETLSSLSALVATLPPRGLPPT